ncbi:helix-turn-helix domain-containing protein [Yoonia sp. R2331]|uniref:helix-turn-helix domain-containing protein n=1 Tax=Yoonia sp. R2331 TaxID=3237238 RepID=UPI0034E4C8A2
MGPNVPNNIAKHRRALDMSQDTLAGKLGITKSQVSRLERGLSSITQSRMLQLTELFGIEPHALFNDAASREDIDLDLMRAVIVQLDEMLLRLGVNLTPEQRGDLTVELYRLEVRGLDEDQLSDHQVNIKRFEGMVKALGN